MNTVEDAYKLLAQSLIGSANSIWDELIFTTKILNKNCGSMQTLERNHIGEKYLSLGMEKVFAVNDAALFLRDDLLRTTGHRIWGLTFTLYPDGKFNIEYDYNKPEGHEETDETVEVDLAGLQNITRDK